MAEIVLQTTDLTREFGGHTAVNRLSIALAEGQILGLLGPNGAGKTTTTKIISTLIAPTSGSARVCGYDVVADPAEVRRVMGYVLQEKGVRHLLTGREALEFEATLYHIPSRLRAAYVDRALRLVDLSDDADRRVATYSGGMTKRLDLACGLINSPRLLVLDEPTLALDVTSRRRIWNYLRRLREQGTAILLATNYMDEAEFLCDEVCILSEGQQVLSGPPRRLKAEIKADLLSVDTSDPQRLLATLNEAGFDWQAGAASETELSVWVANAPSEIPRVVLAAARSGIDLGEIRYQAASLDEVFLHHTSSEQPPVEMVRKPELAEQAGSRDRPVAASVAETGAFLLRSRRETTRERLNLLLTVVQPATWLVLLGTALGRTVDPGKTGTTNYPAFMLPGLIVFLALGVSVSGVIPLIWDRETGYLAKLLSMPIARSSLLVSRIVFQSGLALAQTGVALVVAYLLGVRVAAGLTGVLGIAALVVLLTASLTSLLIALAFSLPGHNTFFAVSGFITLPLLFASTAFVPSSSMPSWLRVVAVANPLSLVIDATRTLVLRGWRAELAGQFGWLMVLAVVSVALATARFRGRRATLQ